MKNQKIMRNRKIRKKRIFLFFRILLLGFVIGCLFGFFVGKHINNFSASSVSSNTDNIQSSEAVDFGDKAEIRTVEIADNSETKENPEVENIKWNEKWEYASFSKIHSDTVNLYHSNSKNRNGIVVAVNAGHGTIGGNNIKTLCHPDGSPKVTGGSTAEGEVYATAISSGTTFIDGTEESQATLSIAMIIKDKLLERGYDVLMLREDDDCQLDNVARTVFANENADCHISLHYDSTDNDKGFFYISVPDVESYRNMDPVSKYWKEHLNLGDSILDGALEHDIKIFNDGSLPIDLTQTSYSMIPSVDLELGDRASDTSEDRQTVIAAGIVDGVEKYYASTDN